MEMRDKWCLAFLLGPKLVLEGAWVGRWMEEGGEEGVAAEVEADGVGKETCTADWS
jgi:hypothetical protein